MEHTSPHMTLDKTQQEWFACPPSEPNKSGFECVANDGELVAFFEDQAECEHVVMLQNKKLNLLEIFSTNKLQKSTKTQQEWFACPPIGTNKAGYLCQTHDGKLVAIFENQAECEYIVRLHNQTSNKQETLN
jgi:hypothetical protein